MEYMLLNHADPAGLQALREAERSTALAAYAGYYLIDMHDLDSALSWASLSRRQPWHGRDATHRGHGPKLSSRYHLIGSKLRSRPRAKRATATASSWPS